MPDGYQSAGIGTSEWIGTSEQGNLMPALTCNPQKFVKVYEGQHFNPSCFAVPAPPTATTNGQLAQIIWPYIRNPGYFTSDLAIFKAFKVTESQRFEVRISATDWLNHANGIFGQTGGQDDTLRFTGLASQNATALNLGSGNVTGAPQVKLGYRWMQFAGKYYF
jgi:hypothetical protein